MKLNLWSLGLSFFPFVNSNLLIFGRIKDSQFEKSEFFNKKHSKSAIYSREFKKPLQKRLLFSKFLLYIYFMPILLSSFLITVKILVVHFFQNSNNLGQKVSRNLVSIVQFFVLILNLASDLLYVACFGWKSTSKFGLPAQFERLAHYCSYFCIPINPRMTKIDYDYLSIPYKNKKRFKGLLGHCRAKKKVTIGFYVKI